MSSFFLITTVEMPCIGATVTPSVITASPALTAYWRAWSVLIAPNLPRAISSAIVSVALSLVVVWRRWRSLSARPSNCERPSISFTRSARSKTVFDSTISLGSRPSRLGFLRGVVGRFVLAQYVAVVGFEVGWEDGELLAMLPSGASLEGQCFYCCTELVLKLVPQRLGYREQSALEVLRLE